MSLTTSAYSVEFGVMSFGDLMNSRRRSRTAYYGFIAFMIYTIGNVLSRARSAMRFRSKGQSRRNRRFYAAAAELLESRELLSVTSELVADLVQYDHRGSNIEQVSFGSEVAFFTASTESAGTELWKSDGTPLGTTLVRDILPGPESSGISGEVLGIWNNGAGFQTVGSRLTFYGSKSNFNASEHWVTDGTTAGTVSLSLLDGVAWNALTEMSDGRFMFIGQQQDTNSSRLRDLWISDGTPAGTARQTGVHGDR